MATKKDPGTARYRVIRDYAEGAAGDYVMLSPDDAALLIRDGIVEPAEGSDS